ncbi:MAG TPA: ATP-dependent helicase [Mycobacteriales bacterium]|jgi:ATP-dependent Lhr-like helicase|nr:ATP-dependent helicase [Mycobacteriales bacterium]
MWFTGAFAAPTPAQEGAWDAISSGRDTLVVAPTGSGKTLSAFLWSLDRLAATPPPDEPRHRCRVLYVSPLKALAVDVERNLRSPLTGIRQAAQRLDLPVPDLRVGIRSGDTPADERRAFNKVPPDVFITTPESLFLVLTSAARESLRGVETVIVDEVHAVSGTKRGAHLALSLERLDELLERPAQRIGLSATVRPIDEVARFLGGSRDVVVVQPPSTKTIEVEVVVPVEDMSGLGESVGPVRGGSAAGAEPRASIWPAVEERIVDLVEQHRSTIVFANSRRLAERLTSRLNEIATERAHGVPEVEPVDLDRPAGSAGVKPFGASFQRGPAAHPGQGGTSAPWGNGTGTGGEGVVEIARAHHGSVSREQRSVIEESLKAGRLPAVVATSSLELGIDMGAVDLVIQVESPPSVASGLQRVGRAGHQVGAVSRGIILPKYRGDLVQCAVVAERMVSGGIESTTFPRNPLDVLAQQVVAMCAMESWQVDDLAALVRRSAPFAGLPQSALEAVLDMLSGRYPSDDFAELRPRITWDRVTGVLAGRPGAQRLAVTSGGTIPDRGMFGVFLVGAGASDPASGGRQSRVGELDEEMVYESRVGDVFLLGSSAWRIEDITHDRVLVTPAPGQPGRMPYWHGDAPGRPVELGRALGAFLREVSALTPQDGAARLHEAGLDAYAADNLLAYLAEQREATGVLPDDRTILVERFRDELGDWRLAIHSPFGAQVNQPWALALAARLRESYGVDVQSMHSDDGIVLRLPETEEAPTGSVAVFEPDEVEPAVQAEVGGSALFASRFRECAARALLLPRRNPTRRTPLWQQRQRSAQLLSVAAQYGSFPVVLETMREVLQDVFDVPGLVQLMKDVESRKVRLVEVETQQPSPFARSLLFGYIGAFMYEGDAPLAERRANALSLDSALLAELLGQAELRELIDADALAEVEAEVQLLAEDRRAKDLETTADLLRRLGDLTTAEVEERGGTGAWLVELEGTRRAIRVRIAGEQRWAAVEDAGRLQDALGTALPVGVAEAFTEPVRDPLGDLVSRYARTHGPFAPPDVARRFGLGVAVVDAALARLAASGRVAHGEFRPGGSGLEWCDAEVLRMLRRRSLAKLRKEVEPVPPEALARFLPQWQGLGGASGRGADGLLRAVEQLAGVAVPASALETLVLPSRVAGYTSGLLDELTTAGEVLWAGAGSLPGNDGWVSLQTADAADLLLAPVGELSPTPLHDAVLAALDGGQALFFRALSDRVGSVDDSALVAVVWDLVWAGRLTNDTFGPLRALLAGGRTAHGAKKAPVRQRSRYGRPVLPQRGGPPTAAGRWSLLPDRDPDPTRRTHALAEALLDRHGVVTRGAVVAERAPGGFAAVYQVLKAFEESGRVRRGYFVEGLGAAQFAAAGAVDRMRALAAVRPAAEEMPWQTPVPGGWDASPYQERQRKRRDDARALVLAATDPANPYGAALPWPAQDSGHRPGRKAGALVVLVDGRVVLYVERGGKTLLSFTDDETCVGPAADALALAVRDGALGKLTVEKADGEPALTSPLGLALEHAGFRPTPRGLRLRS